MRRYEGSKDGAKEHGDKNDEPYQGQVVPHGTFQKVFHAGSGKSLSLKNPGLVCPGSFFILYAAGYAAAVFCARPRRSKVSK